MKNVLLVRHGESAANAGLPTVTPEDIPLTEIGREQAEAVAKSIPFCPDMIISSPFLRARQTAEPAVERFIGSRFGLWPKVREFTYLSPASCIGTTVADRKDRVEAYWNAADPDYVDGEGAESFRQFMLRVDEVIKKLNDLSAKNIVLFTHGQFMKALILEQQNVNFRKSDIVGKMRLFREGKGFANGEVVWLEGVQAKQ